MGKKNGIPDRWLDYTPVGQRIQGTNIIAFKVPLKTDICERRLDSDLEWFTPAILLRSQPQIKAVIDLTNTHKYYDPEEFRSEGIDHFKIMAEGRGEIPPRFKIQEFYDAVEFVLSKYSESPDALIGVHCTHGLNRTGYFVCRWMVDRLKMTPDDAISRFEAARGHKIERDSYINNIKFKDPLGASSSSSTSQLRPSKYRDHIEYSSPLGDPYYEDSVPIHRNRRPDPYHYTKSRPTSRSGCDRNWRARDTTCSSQRHGNPSSSRDIPRGETSSLSRDDSFVRDKVSDDLSGGKVDFSSFRSRRGNRGRAYHNNDSNHRHRSTIGDNTRSRGGIGRSREDNLSFGKGSA